MAAGIQYSKSGLDSIAGQLAQQFKHLMEQAADFEAWLSAQQTADLTNLGYATSDIAVLQGAAADMALLVQVATGQATVATAHSFS